MDDRPVKIKQNGNQASLRMSNSDIQTSKNKNKINPIILSKKIGNVRINSMDDSENFESSKLKVIDL